MAANHSLKLAHERRGVRGGEREGHSKRESKETERVFKIGVRTGGGRRSEGEGARELDTKKYTD